MKIKLIEKILNYSTNKWTLFLSICFFLSSCVCFCSGITYSQTIMQNKSVELARVIENCSETDFISIQVSPITTDSKSKMPNTYNEYFYWKYIFRDSNFSFLSTANGGKQANCFYKEIDAGANISFVYSGNNLNPEYDNYFKHEVYDIKLMFKGYNKINEGAINFFAISETRARQLLEMRSIQQLNGEYSIDQYKQLIGTNTTLIIENQEYLFTIANIYFEEGDFYQNVRNNFGEFTISYIYFPEPIKNEATYIFNKYDYQNLHKLKRMRSFFNSEEFTFDFSTFNLKNGLNNDFINSFNTVFEKRIGNDALAIVIALIDVFIFLISIFFFFISKQMHSLPYNLIILGSFLLPYLLLGFINLFYKIPILFSYFSLIMYLIFVVTIIALLTYTFIKEKGFKLLIRD